MPKLGDITKKFAKWSDINEMEEGSFGDIEPGLYVLEITSCEGHDKDEYFSIEWDVAEGEFKGNYAKSQYPPSTRIYWREKSLGFLKHRLHVLADWNDKFKASTAFETDQWGKFVGKKFGAVVRRRLYTAGPNSKQPGADRVQMEIAAWLSPDDFKAGNYKEALLADNDMRDKSQTAQQLPQQASNAVAVPDSYSDTEDVYDEDIPF